MTGPAYLCLGVVEGGARIVDILGQFSYMLVYVQSVERVSKNPTASWFIFRLTIGPVGVGSVRTKDEPLLADMMVDLFNDFAFKLY